MTNNSEIPFRVLDILISLILLILFSPLLILISICIKVSDFKAPVFAGKHWRVGKKGKLFFMYKFRTMIPNASEILQNDPDLKAKYEKGLGKIRLDEDIRVTKFGKFLRRFDLDELPQLFNVLKGDMSMVGPRAYFKEEIDLYSQKHGIFEKKIRKVLNLKPGITGIWQISGRNLLTIPKRISCDYEYLKKKSIILYLLILLKTPYIVLTRYGAYD